MREKIYESPRGNVHYWINEDYHEGAAWLVFLPGLSADHTLFDTQINHFAPRFNCLTWDAPAHAASRPYALDFSLDEMAQILHAILETESIEMPFMIGQSLGAYIMQAYLELFPRSMRAFVSIDSASLQRGFYTKTDLWFLRNMEPMYKLYGTEHFLRTQVAKNCCTTAVGQQGMLTMIAPYSKAELCKLTGKGFLALARAIEADKPYVIDCPVLLLCGDKDSAGFTKKYNRMWANKTGYELVWVKDAGHNSNVDDPQFVNITIDEFLDRVLKTP